MSNLKSMWFLRNKQHIVMLVNKLKYLSKVSGGIGIHGSARNRSGFRHQCGGSRPTCLLKAMQLIMTSGIQCMVGCRHIQLRLSIDLGR